MADDSLGLGINDPAYLELVKKQQEALVRANQPYGMDAGQGAIAAGLGLLPALVGGLVKGKEGLNIGLQAGLGGVNMYDKTLQSNFERASENEKANAALYGAQANQVLQNDLGFKRFMQQEKVRQDNRKEMAQIDPRGARISVNIPSADSGAVDKDTRKLIQPQLDIYQSMSQSINSAEGVLKENPELNKLNYNDIDGSMKTLGEGAKAWVLGSDTPLGRLKAETMAAATDYAKAISGAAVSDKEFERLYSIVAGAGKVPATPAIMLQTLRHVRSKVGERAKMAAISGGMMTGRYKSTEEALSAPAVQGVDNMLNFLSQGNFGQTTQKVQRLEGPKGAFTVGAK